MRVKEVANSNFIVVQPISPMSTLLKFFPSEGSTSMKLQSSFQVFTIGFPGSNEHYNQSFKFIPYFKTKHSTLLE